VWVSGGTGPFTLWFENTRVGGFAAGEIINFQLIGRRCNVSVFTVIVRDDGTNTELVKGQSFDPAANGPLFPNGACTLP
jgi:hypothetical protein